MTYEEAIENLEYIKEYCHYDYEEKAVDLAIKALKKQVPMKPKSAFFEGKVNICPKCSRIITNEKMCECGQRILWE